MLDDDASSHLTTEDLTGCVQVRTDKSMGRVEGVRLSARWRDKVGAGGLAGALLHAVVRGRVNYLEASSVDDAHTDAPRSIASGLRPGALAGLSFERRLEAWNRVTDLLAQVNGETAKALSRVQTRVAGSDGAEANSDYSGSDERRNVSVTLNSHGALAGVTIEERWLASASTERIVESVREAFASAYESLDAATADEPMMTAVADRVRALMSDPVRFERWLRQEGD